MPVVTPSRASIETVNAVSCSDWLRRVIGLRPSCSQRSALSARQIRPRASLAMKLTDSGVTNCAAITRSPSFSRSSPSHTITVRPARMSATASSIVSNGLLMRSGPRAWRSRARGWWLRGARSNRDRRAGDRARLSPLRDGRGIGGGLLREQPMEVARGPRGRAGASTLHHQAHADGVVRELARGDRAALLERVSEHAVARQHGDAEPGRDHQLAHLRSVGGVREGRLLASEQAAEVAVHRIPGAHRDQRLSEQVGGGERLQLGERAVAVDADDGAPAQELDGVQLGRDLVAVEVVDEPEVEAAVEQRAVQELLLGEHDVHLRGGMRLAERADRGGEQRRGRGADGPEPDRAAALVLLVGGGAQALGGLDHVEQVRQQLASLGANGGAGALAIEDVHPQLGLELAHALAQRGLRDVQLLGGAPERSEARDRGRVFDLLYAHGRPVANKVNRESEELGKPTTRGARAGPAEGLR